MQEGKNKSFFKKFFSGLWINIDRSSKRTLRSIKDFDSWIVFVEELITEKKWRKAISAINKLRKIEKVNTSLLLKNSSNENKTTINKAYLNKISALVDFEKSILDSVKKEKEERKLRQIDDRIIYVNNRLDYYIKNENYEKAKLVLNNFYEKNKEEEKAVDFYNKEKILFETLKTEKKSFFWKLFTNKKNKATPIKEDEVDLIDEKSEIKENEILKLEDEINENLIEEKEPIIDEEIENLGENEVDSTDTWKEIETEENIEEPEINKSVWFFWKIFWKKEVSKNDLKKVKNFDSAIKLIRSYVYFWSFDKARLWLDEIKLKEESSFGLLSDENKKKQEETYNTRVKIINNLYSEIDKREKLSIQESQKVEDEEVVEVQEDEKEIVTNVEEQPDEDKLTTEQDYTIKSLEIEDKNLEEKVEDKEIVWETEPEIKKYKDLIVEEIKVEEIKDIEKQDKEIIEEKTDKEEININKENKNVIIRFFEKLFSRNQKDVEKAVNLMWAITEIKDLDKAISVAESVKDIEWKNVSITESWPTNEAWIINEWWEITEKQATPNKIKIGVQNYNVIKSEQKPDTAKQSIEAIEKPSLSTQSNDIISSEIRQEEPQITEVKENINVIVDPNSPIQSEIIVTPEEKPDDFLKSDEKDEIKTTFESSSSTTDEKKDEEKSILSSIFGKEEEKKVVLEEIKDFDWAMRSINYFMNIKNWAKAKAWIAEIKIKEEKAFNALYDKIDILKEKNRQKDLYYKKVLKIEKLSNKIENEEILYNEKKETEKAKIKLVQIKAKLDDLIWSKKYYEALDLITTFFEENKNSVVIINFYNKWKNKIQKKIKKYEKLKEKEMSNNIKKEAELLIWENINLWTDNANKNENTKKRFNFFKWLWEKINLYKKIKQNLKEKRLIDEVTLLIESQNEVDELARKSRLENIHMWLVKELDNDNLLWYELYAKILWRDKISWDTFWFVEDDKNYKFFLWDATWHWIQAWLIVTLLTRLFYNFSKDNFLEKLVYEVNNWLKQDLKSWNFITWIFFEVDKVNLNNIKYVWMWHEPMLIFRKKTMEVEKYIAWWLAAWIRIINDINNIKTHNIKLNDWDIVFIYSDWIVESRNKDNQLLWIDWLAAILKKVCIKYSEVKITDMYTSIMEEVRSYRWWSTNFYDDATIFILKRNTNKDLMDKSSIYLKDLSIKEGLSRKNIKELEWKTKEEIEKKLEKIRKEKQLSLILSNLDKLYVTWEILKLKQESIRYIKEWFIHKKINRFLKKAIQNERKYKIDLKEQKMKSKYIVLKELLKKWSYNTVIAECNEIIAGDWNISI